MSDSLEINSLVTNESFNQDLMSFSDAQWEWISDYNNGNYSSNQINFQTQQLVSKWVDYYNGYLAIPVKITSSGTAYTQATEICPKALVSSFLTGLLLQTASGQTLVNDTNLQFINHIRSAVEMTVQEYDSVGPELFWYKDEVELQSATTGVKNPIADSDKNLGFLKRIVAFKETLKWNDSDKSFTTVLSIPLRFIHDVFMQMKFPLINISFNMSFTFSGAGQDTYFRPLMVESGAAPVVTIYPGAQFPGTQTTLNACRMYFRSVKFSPSLAQKLAQELKNGLTKELNFRISDFYSYNNGAKVDSSTISHLISPSTIAPIRCWVVAPDNGSLTSSNGLANYVGLFSNINMLVNNTRYYSNDLATSRDCWEVVKDQFLDKNECVISFKDFITSYGVHCLDLSRMQSRLRDSNAAVSLQFQGQLVTDDVNVFFIVERKEKIVFKMSASDCSVVVGLNQ